MLSTRSATQYLASQVMRPMRLLRMEVRPPHRSALPAFQHRATSPVTWARRLRSGVRTVSVSWIVVCWAGMLRLQTYLANAQRGGRDRGSQTTDFLLIAGIVAATALAVGAIIGPKLIAKAQSISLSG